MRIKLVAAGAAIALAATIGTAAAAGQFSTLEGIAAQALTPQEMGVVVGGAPGDITLTLPLVAASQASANAPTTGPTAIKHSPILHIPQGTVPGCTGGVCTFGIVTME